MSPIAGRHARVAVFDCNVYLQAILSTHGAAYACWQQVVVGKAILIVTPHVLKELRSLPDHKSLRRFTQFTADRVERFIEELLDVARFVADPATEFIYDRDPDDAVYVNVAVAYGAMLVVSNDKDLLDLMNDTNGEGKLLRSTYPTFQVVTPPRFLEMMRGADFS